MAFTDPWADVQESNVQTLPSQSDIPAIGDVIKAPSESYKTQPQPNQVRKIDFDKIKIGAGSRSFDLSLGALKDNYVILVPLDGAKEHPDSDYNGNPTTKQRAIAFILNDNPTFWSTKKGTIPLEWSNKLLKAGDTVIVETKHKAIKSILTQNYQQKDNPYFTTPQADGSLPQKEILAGRLEMGTTEKGAQVLRLVSLEKGAPKDVVNNWKALAKERTEFLKEYADFL